MGRQYSALTAAKQFSSSPGTSLECGVTSPCYLASRILEGILVHVKTYSVVLWYTHCHLCAREAHGNSSGATGLEGGELALSLETSDNYFAPKFQI